MIREHEEFEVETDRPGEWPMRFWSETVKAGGDGVAVGLHLNQPMGIVVPWTTLSEDLADLACGI